MKTKWKKICEQLTTADTDFEDFLDNAGLSVLSIKKSEKFRKSWNLLKKTAADFDKYISPVEMEIKFPFHTQEMTDMWQRWKNYLSEQHGELIRTASEQSALEHLHEISKGDEKKAVHFLRFAMTKRYKNFFQVEDKDVKQPAKGDTGVGSDF